MRWIIEIRLYADDETGTAALPIITSISAERDPAIAVSKHSAHCLIVDVNSLLRIAYRGADVGPCKCRFAAGRRGGMLDHSIRPRVRTEQA